MKVTIFQLRDIGQTDYAFRSFNSKKFSPEDYKKVYELERRDGFYVDVLEDIFSQFNHPERMPKDFRGHSLSVSDVVFLEDKGYYCDAFSWSPVTGFKLDDFPKE